MPSPQPEESPDLDPIVPHTLEEAFDSLVPPFEAYCRRTGLEADLSTDGISFAEQFNRTITFQFFGDPVRISSLFNSNILKARGIAEPKKLEPGIGLVTEITEQSTGLAVIPTCVVQGDDSPTKLPRFYKIPKSEVFVAPAGLIAKINPGERFTLVEPVLANPAIKEARDHLGLVSSQVLRDAGKDPNFVVSTIRTGSVLVAVMLEAVQRAHEQGDEGIKVEGPLELGPLFKKKPQASAILGVNQIKIKPAGLDADITIHTLDPRDFDAPITGETRIHRGTGIPLIRKTYSCRVDVIDGMIAEPQLQRVHVAPFDRNAA
ncbi:MAG: hypothetical protein J0M12_16235 [Deltaproteobacteria bacterium]|nr:hypothetical protein [Deltaproteobacteria bacterium]